MAGKIEPVKQDQDSVKHDIRNQLSNIAFCAEQLRFELPQLNDDIKFYIDTIAAGCKKINELLRNTD